MSAAARETIESLNSYTGEKLGRFNQIFDQAINTVGEPIFFAPKYERHLWECASSVPTWLPRVLTACATTESNGSRSLLGIWSKIRGHEDVEKGILAHARDEAGHARLFIELAQLVCPANYEPAYLEDVHNSLFDAKTVTLKSETELVGDKLLIDYLIQLNIVEMRTRFHLVRLAPMFYSLAPGEAKPRVEKILNALARDELHHISYTARLIDEWAADDDIDRLVGVYGCRLQLYHQHTLDQIDEMKKAFGGTFPDLL